MYAVILAPSAPRDLYALSPDVQRRISAALDGLSVNPRPPPSKPLKGDTARWRLRVGDHRVVYRIDDDRVIVLAIKIAHRNSVYRR